MDNLSFHEKLIHDPNISHGPGSDRMIDPLQEPFLNFDSTTRLTFEDKSTIYSSLVTLVKEQYPLNNALQDRAVRFLKSLEPNSFDGRQAEKLVSDLVPTSTEPPSGFVKSILTLLSSPHSTVVTAALSFLSETRKWLSIYIKCRLVESDLIANVLAVFQPHTLPISKNETIFSNLIEIVNDSLRLALPSSLDELAITTAIEKYNHREMIFQKIVLPSSQFVTFLISNRHVLGGDLLYTFMSLLSTLITIGPFHLPTLEFVVASPIVMAFSSCLHFVENDQHLWLTLVTINHSLDDWKKEGREVVQSAKRMIQALFSEGFEDTLEQTLMRKRDKYLRSSLVMSCHSISRMLGSNVVKL